MAKRAKRDGEKVASGRRSTPGLTPPGSPVTASGYDAQKTRAHDRQAEQSRSGRDIGPPPKCKNPRRRAKSEKCLRTFCETYLKARFPLPWSQDHLDQLREIQRVVTDGGLQAIAAPRGDGKTTRLEAGVLWGVLTGRHSYAVLLTATAAHAPKRMHSIKQELLRNDLLLEDWPEVCYPIRAMGGISNRCTGQLSEGVSTSMAWGKRQIVLPTIPGSRCSSAILECAGLLEATRGLNYATSAGVIARPTVALIDDPQTNRSARSKIQSEERETAIAAGIIHLPGPDKTISALLSCTVIQQGDMADQLLKREIHPEWHGVRKKLVYSMPSNTALWDEYAELYRQDMAAGGDGSKATKFYRANRKAMDAGGEVAWSHRKAVGEASALEHAMRLLIRDRSSFFSEMQNEPEADTSAETVQMLTAEQIAAKVNGFERYKIPVGCNRLTWFVDVHKEVLFYAVIAWQEGFTGYIVDYGTWPRQAAVYFDLRHARQTIDNSAEITATTMEGKIAQALDCLFAELSGRIWRCEDGSELPMAKGLVDANWGDSTNTVYDVCRQAHRKHGLSVMPSHGVSFGPSKRPISRWERRSVKGQVGDEWHIPPPSRGRAIRHVLFDANRRKSFVHRRLATPVGDPGSLTLFHAPSARHRLIAEHLTAETGVRVSGPYGSLTEWRLTPGRDNHWLDCISGCCTAESMLGGKLKPSITRASSEPVPQPASTASRSAKRQAATDEVGGEPETQQAKSQETPARRVAKPKAPKRVKYVSL